MTTLAIAAGGGGDAITAAALAERFGAVAIMTYSWDRLLIDPTPGPRARADFRGLIDLGAVARVPSSADLRVGRSTVPSLARHLRQPLLLMDPTDGAVGLAAQIAGAAEVFGADEVVVVDVGGDILGRGDEPELRSPLADAVALAATVRTGLPAWAAVAGIGMDGELSPAQSLARLTALGATRESDLSAAEFDAFESIWAWHPSEANGLVAAAAGGWRGTVETQRRSVVEVTDAATWVYRVDAAALAKSTPAHYLGATVSLDEIETLLRERRGYSDIDVERGKRDLPERAPVADVVGCVDRYARRVAERGVDAMTIRRVLEMARAADPAAARALRLSLASRRTERFRPPLYLCR
ncbi:DUF1152 domain-containing protein [Nocardia takedensis]